MNSIFWKVNGVEGSNVYLISVKSLKEEHENYKSNTNKTVKPI